MVLLDKSDAIKAWLAGRTIVDVDASASIAGGGRAEKKDGAPAQVTIEVGIRLGWLSSREHWAVLVDVERYPRNPAEEDAVYKQAQLNLRAFLAEYVYNGQEFGPSVVRTFMRALDKRPANRAIILGRRRDVKYYTRNYAEVKGEWRYDAM